MLCYVIPSKSPVTRERVSFSFLFFSFPFPSSSSFFLSSHWACPDLGRQKLIKCEENEAAQRTTSLCLHWSPRWLPRLLLLCPFSKRSPPPLDLARLTSVSFPPPPPPPCHSLSLYLYLLSLFIFGDLFLARSLSLLKVRFLFSISLNIMENGEKKRL